MRANRRTHPRFIKRLKTEFSSDSKNFSGILSNLSENGLFIRTRKSFVPGTIIDIELLMPDGKKSFLKGRIVWARKTPLSTLKNGMGVDLINKDASYINFLKSLTEGTEIQVENNTVKGIVVYKTKEPIEEKESIEYRLRMSNVDSCISNGRYEEAMVIYNKLLSIEPGNPFILQRIEELKTLVKLLGKE